MNDTNALGTQFKYFCSPQTYNENFVRDFLGQGVKPYDISARTSVHILIKRDNVDLFGITDRENFNSNSSIPLLYELCTHTHTLRLNNKYIVFGKLHRYPIQKNYLSREIVAYFIFSTAKAYLLTLKYSATIWGILWHKKCLRTSFIFRVTSFKKQQT
ncbi:UNVERIFIED_CONTAM: hypothetical protein RMT77_007428 [Armadillidium vulgare]